MRRTHVVLAFAAASLLACASHDYAQPAAPTTVVSVTSAPVSGDLDDAQIATIAETIRSGLQERARLAIERDSSASVKTFARRILADDPGVSVTLMNLAPRSSILGDELASSTRAATEDLSVRSGVDFDRRFVEAQRTAMRDAIQLLDQRLIPSARNETLKKNLIRMSATLADEMHEADRLLQQVPLSPTTLPNPRLR